MPGMQPEYSSSVPLMYQHYSDVLTSPPFFVGYRNFEVVTAMLDFIQTESKTMTSDYSLTDAISMISLRLLILRTKRITQIASCA